MSLEQLLIILLVGGVAGWIASLLVKGRGNGILINIVVGIIGALIGAWLFGALGIGVAGLLGQMVMAICGAVVLLLIVGALGGRRGRR